MLYHLFSFLTALLSSSMINRAIKTITINFITCLFTFH